MPHTIKPSEDYDSASPFLPIPRSAFIFPNTDANDITAAQSPYPNRPLASASSSGSLTERPARHGRVISTTITPDDLTKWMEKGTFGSQMPEAMEAGVETHVVCMLQRDVEAGLAATEDSAENKMDHATGVEASKKLKNHNKGESLNQVFKDAAVDQEPQAREDEGHETAEFIAGGALGERETGQSVMRCGQCGGQVIVFQDDGDKAICLNCGGMP